MTSNPTSEKAENGQEKQVRKQILETANEIEPELMEIYHDFHENPELGGQEYRTSQKVSTFLKDLGIEIIGEKVGGLRGKEGTGIVARIKGKNQEAAIALRADMDALPMAENENNPHKSKNPGVMHACGHDAHTTGLMGAAKILKQLADDGDLPNDVYLIFQQNEESYEKGSGAAQIVRFMEKKGLRKNIRAFFGLHVFSELERGNVKVRHGAQLASGGQIDIKATAPGGHVMNAYEQPNLHLIFSEITVRLSKLFRDKAKKKEALISSPRTRYEGTAGNILPTEAESSWTVRITSPDYKQISKQVLQDVKKVVGEVVAKSPEAEKVKVEIKGMQGYRPVLNRSKELVEIAEKSAGGIIPSIKIDREVLMAGEDFSNYMEKLRGLEIPGVFMLVGAANKAKNIPPVTHHNPNFRIDEGVLKDVAALYCDLAVSTMKKS